jgi:DNA invertase Pin-like site-specific DNA recombinase
MEHYAGIDVSLERERLRCRRDLRARTGEGRARAKANGQSLGRKPKLTPHQRSEAIERRDRGEALWSIARSYNVHPSTISRLTA